VSAATAEENQRASLVERSVASVLSTGPFRAAALFGVFMLAGSYVGKLYTVTRFVGGSALFLPVIVATLIAATVLARTIDARTAAAIAGVLVIVGYGYYVFAVDAGLSLLLTRLDQVVADTVALLTGLNVTRIARADAWALAFAPGPLFLSWYFALRRRYLVASVIGGAALLVLVLTGDAGPLLTLSGVLGGVAAVGFGELDRRGGTLLQADVLVVLVALITVLSLSLTLVPAGAASPLKLGSFGGGGGTVEGTFVGTPGEMTIAGAVDLSPSLRYTVEADRPRYWRTGVYDRFLGGRWVRTGQSTEYDPGVLDSPPGPREPVVQTYTAESKVKTMPAAAEPVEVVGEATANTRVTEQNALKPSSMFIPGDRYRIRSLVLNATADELRSAGTDYPAPIVDRYTEVPDSTANSDRFQALLDEITAGADTPYDTATRIETYLERTKNYSLDVQKPSGNVANEFLLEMDEGYCTYFATTMTVMLRSEGIPARVAVGYTTGQQVAEDEYVVRGLNSHVWVEAYVPDHGWVTFDPTPVGPRQSVETERLQQAREEDGGDGPIDTGESEDVPVTTTAAPSPNGTTNRTAAGVGPGSITIPRDGGQRPTIPGGANATPAGSGGERGGLPPLPSRRDAAIGAVLILGAAAGAHRIRLPERVYRAARLRWQGARGTPNADVERAYDRLEMLLARQYRPRHTGETHREYVEDLSARGLDERARRVADIHERARYAGRVDRETADEAISLVDAMVRERTPAVGGIRRRFGG